jgi:hypothetical protein
MLSERFARAHGVALDESIFSVTYFYTRERRPIVTFQHGRFVLPPGISR